MRRVELELEHRYKNRFVGKHRLSQGSGHKVIGSSRDADIRLLGEDIEGVHALIECVDGHKWSISDMGSQNGTWVQKQPIIEHIVEGETFVTIGSHHLRMTLKEINSDLFTVARQEQQKPSEGEFTFHQVIVRKGGFVLESVLLKEDEQFEFVHGGKTHHFKTPQQMDEWHTTVLGEFEIQNRKVRSGLIAETPTNFFRRGCHIGRARRVFPFGDVLHMTDKILF